MQIFKFPLWICALALCGAMTLQAQDSAVQAAARSALEQKMKELDTNSTDIPSSTPADAAVVPAAPAAAASTAPPATAVAAPAAAAATATAVEAAPTTPAPVVATPPPAETAPATAKTEVADASTKPAPAASAPPTLSKAERLSLLLGQYKADQITPQEYHTQRAAIMAEP